MIFLKKILLIILMEKENYNNCHWNMDTIHFSQFLTLISAYFLLEASYENKIK